MPSPRYWREIPTRYRLEAGKCKACGTVAYPSRLVCPSCQKTDFEPLRLSRHGTVVTYTVIHVGPDSFQMEAPYPLAIVETPEGARLMAQIADCDPADVRVGMEVALEFRKINAEGHSGIICYGHKGVPA
jgi:hypothetical protein